MRYFTALIILSFLFILSSNTHAVHECGSPHEQENSAEHEKHGCDDLVETDFFYGDSRGDSPELAGRGSYKVGVRTLELVNPNQPDVIKYSTQKQNSLMIDS